MANLKLTIVSQEEKLTETTATQVTAPGSEGELTILPYHSPLFTRLKTGVLYYTDDKDQSKHNLVVSKGFITVNPDNEVTVMVDTAVDERDISVDKAEQAIADAKETINDKTASERELLQAEASMRKAMWEIKLAQKRKSNL